MYGTPHVSKCATSCGRKSIIKGNIGKFILSLPLYPLNSKRSTTFFKTPLDRANGKEK